MLWGLLLGVAIGFVVSSILYTIQTRNAIKNRKLIVARKVTENETKNKEEEENKNKEEEENNNH